MKISSKRYKIIDGSFRLCTQCDQLISDFRIIDFTDQFPHVLPHPQQSRDRGWLSIDFKYYRKTILLILCTKFKLTEC
jgi:hypothetical protein